MQGTYKAHANKQRVEQGRQPLMKNAAARHDWGSDKGLAAVHATARQEHIDIQHGGAPARRKRQRKELREKAGESGLSVAENTRLQALESIEADDDAVLEDFRERKWGRVPQAMKGARHAHPRPQRPPLTFRGLFVPLVAQRPQARGAANPQQHHKVA